MPARFPNWNDGLSWLTVGVDPVLRNPHGKKQLRLASVSSMCTTSQQSCRVSGVLACLLVTGLCASSAMLTRAPVECSLQFTQINHLPSGSSTLGGVLGRKEKGRQGGQEPLCRASSKGMRQDAILPAPVLMTGDHVSQHLPEVGRLVRAPKTKFQKLSAT